MCLEGIVSVKNGHHRYFSENGKLSGDTSWYESKGTQLEENSESSGKTREEPGF